MSSIGWTLQLQDEAVRLDVSIDFRLSVFSSRTPVWLLDMRNSLILGGTRQAGEFVRGQRPSVSFFDLEDGIMG
jgi:hypothetical protein